jgi:hypothetical protein
VANPYY